MQLVPQIVWCHHSSQDIKVTGRPVALNVWLVFVGQSRGGFDSTLRFEKRDSFLGNE